MSTQPLIPPSGPPPGAGQQPSQGGSGNPIVDELAPLHAHIQSLSPAAKQALVSGLTQAHAASQAPTADLGLHNAPSPTLAPAEAAAKAPAPLQPPSAPPVALGGSPTMTGQPSLDNAPLGPSITAPRGTVEGEQNETGRLLSTGSGIHQIQNPFLKGLAGTADAVGRIVAPGIERLIPGTEGHHQGLLQQSEGTENTLLGQQGEQAKTGEANANAARQNAIAAAEPEIADARQQTAEAAIERAERPAKTPDLRPEKILGPDGDPVMANYHPDTGTYTDKDGNPIANPRPAPAASKESHVPVLGDDGRPTFANYDNGKWTDSKGSPIHNPRPIPPPPSYGQLVLPSKVETFIDPVSNLPTMMQYDPKTQTYSKPMGLSASNAYGHEAAQAGAVERSAASLIQTIQENHDKLGTLGAWVKKNGLNTPIADPTLEGIRAQMASFAALNPAMHGAKGTQAMQHFERIIGDIQQNPDATIAGIRGMVQGAAEPILGQGGSGVSVKAPNGKSYSFPDQASADRFKAEAGIK